MSQTLYNFNRTTKWTPSHAFRPAGLDELADIVRRTEGEIKAGGSRLGYDAAATTGAYIHPEGMSFIGGIYGDLVRVGSGTTIRTLNEALWARGRALEVLGGYDGQTIVGLASTGTHGSRLTHGPIAELIRSMDVVLADGRCVRIEPTAGVPELPPELPLIRDDDTFHAALISLGTFGIIHSVALKTVPKFFLREERMLHRTRALQSLLRGGGIYDLESFHVELLVNPATDSTVVTRREPVEADDHFSRRPDRKGAWLQDRLHAVVGPLVDRTPACLVPKITEATLRNLVAPSYTQRSYNVFHIGDGANAIRVQTASFFVPLRDDAWLVALDVLRAVSPDQRGPISVRFVKGSRAWLAPAEDVAAFECISVGSREGPFERQRLALRTVFGRDLALHWGQSLRGATASDFESARYSKWRRIRDRFDAAGRFLNESQRGLLPEIA